MQLGYAKEYIKLQERSDEQEVKLKGQIDQIIKDKMKNLKLLILSTTLFLLGLTACQKQPQQHRKQWSSIQQSQRFRRRIKRCYRCHS